MVRRSVGSVDAWWRAIEAVRLLRGLSRRDLARIIQDAVPRRASEARRSPGYAEVYHRGMLIPRAFAAMEALGCRLCGWRSLSAMLAGLEDSRRSKRRRPATEVSPASAGSRTLLRDALASGELWIEIDDTDDAGFEAALVRVAEGKAADDASQPKTAMWSQTVTDPRVDALVDRLDRLEGRLDVAGKRGRPRRGHVEALEERLAALEARVLAVEAALQGSQEGEPTASQEHRDEVTGGDDSIAPDPIDEGDSSGDEAALPAALIDPEPVRGGDTDVPLAAADDDDNADIEDVVRAADEDPDDRPQSPGGELVSDSVEIWAQTSSDVGEDADEAARPDVDAVIMAVFRQVTRDFVALVDDDDDVEGVDTDSQERGAAPGSSSDTDADEPQVTGPTTTPAPSSGHREKRRRKKRKKRRR